MKSGKSPDSGSFLSPVASAQQWEERDETAEMEEREEREGMEGREEREERRERGEMEEPRLLPFHHFLILPRGAGR